MKKKILIIALVCILAGVAAFYIVKVNNMYPQGSVTEYEINEQVELSGYSACVNSYKVMSIDDFMNEYGIDKRKDRSDTQDEIYVMVAQCTLDITGEMKGFLNTELLATILMVTHDAFTASYAGRVIFIKDGKIFNEIRRGESTRKEFFDKIIDVVTLLGGDLNNAL